MPAHLAEVEARGIHRARACASLSAYCIYELRLSEDSAFRYARAAKLAREFPVLLEQIAAGEIHLTGLLLLGPHLTEENHREVLRLAKHRTKREITKLVRRLDPLPDVAPRIEPLGPARTGQPLSSATWSAFMQALNPVRELAPAERPRNWTLVGDAEPESPEASEVAEIGPSSAEAQDEAAPSLNPQRYSVQFTATEEYVDLVERARDLLSHAVPDRSLAKVHLGAMRLLVAELEKRKFGARESAPAPRAPAASDDVGDEPQTHDQQTVEPTEAPRRRGENESIESSPGAPAEKPNRRYISARVRREVCERDAQRCAYSAADGRRCEETSCLEFHHHDPFARGGAATVENVALYCRAHNAHAAERDFGRSYMMRRSGRE